MENEVAQFRIDEQGIAELRVKDEEAAWLSC
jgi:hypothetical protein